MAGIALSLAGCLTPAHSAVAAPLPWLYDVDVAVQGRTADARLAVSGAALAEVLSRVSGLAHVPRNARVREALDRPEAYYSRFVFLANGELRIHFAPGAILKLMDEARLPVWSASRPHATVWLMVEQGGVRRIVDGEHPLAAALTVRARQRGLALNLPLMDLEDRMRVRPAVVRGRLYSRLDEASRRYGADVILAGQVQERACVSESPADNDAETPSGTDSADVGLESPAGQMPARSGREHSIEPELPSTDGSSSVAGPVGRSDSRREFESLPEDDSDPEPDPEPATGLSTPVTETPLSCGTAGGVFYSVSLQAWMDGEEFATELAVSDIAQAGLKTADFLADELAGRFAVLARQPNRISLTITGIDSPIGYGRLLGYLDDLEFVSAVEVAAVEAGGLEITLHTRAGFGQLVELFESDGRIRPDPADGTVLVWQGP